VKVALSGLFGRFVARAYLERYFGLSVFAHLTSNSLTLDGRRQVGIVRLARGDLPDWIACTAGLTSLTVAEAKGCHDRSGPAKALERAWNQVHRVDVVAGSRRVGVKRLAVATRWGSATSTPSDPHISVHDPEETGEPIGQEDKDALFIGLLRQHVANLVGPLGYRELADALRRLSRFRFERALQNQASRARTLLSEAPVRDLAGVAHGGGLVGGFVTRAGPLTEGALDSADQDMLARLNLRPVFVGIERKLIEVAISGEAGVVREFLAAPRTDEFGRPDRAGGWIVPLGVGGQSIS